MKTLLCLCILIFMITISYAQFSNPDSSKYYKREIYRIQNMYRDSLIYNQDYAELKQKMQRIRAQSDNYGAFVLSTNISSANFKKFNADNAVSGFAPLSGSALNIGLGFSFKKSRRIFDINIIAFGLNKKTVKGDQSIRTTYSTIFQFEYGYDFIKSRAINIYPYAGIGLRSSTLEYKTPAQTNSSYSNITNVILNNSSSLNTNSELSYQAGIGFEFVLTNLNYTGGTIFFIKAGTNNAFSASAYKVEGIKYNPGFKYGEWDVTLGFKFFGR